MKARKRKKPGKRRLARELALQLIYAMEITGYGVKETVQNYMEADLHEKIPMSEFTDQLIRKVRKNQDELDEALQKVIHNWRLERLSRIDRNLLRLAAAELYHFEDIPPKVSINEYIEMAKDFGDPDSPGFINGILDRLAREIRNQESGENKEG